MQIFHSNRSRGIRWRGPMQLGAIVLLAGCAGSSDESSVVSGKVLLGGSPVAAGTVLFMTDDGHAASAELTSDGTYLLRCVPGRFKIAVTPPAPPDPLATPANAPPARPAASTPSIPKRYHDFGTSGLAIAVKAGNNTFDIALAR